MANGGASPRGYHYLNEFQQCPRRWYIHHILRLVPVKEKSSLIFGKVWHYFIEQYLQTDDLTASSVAAMKELQVYWNQGAYSDEDDYKKHLEWLKSGIPAWVNSYHEMETAFGMGARLSILSVEDTGQFSLADGTIFTGRTDGIGTFTDGRNLVLEHKHTGYSADKTLQSLDLEDQLSGYLLIAKAAHPELDHIDGVLVDITLFKGAIPKTAWSIITRSHDELVDFQLSLIGLSTDLRDRTAAVLEGGNPFLYFPRNGAWCGMFGCPYELICRSRLEQKDLFTLDGFTVEEGESDALSEEA